LALRKSRRGLAAVAAIVFLAVMGARPLSASSPYQPGSIGYDISAPQCPANFPSGGAFGIVGVTNGRAWSVNSCLQAEYQWASSLPAPPAFYMNTANPGPVNPHWQLPGPRSCFDYSTANDSGCAYNYGWNAASDAFSTASSAVGAGAAAGHMWWLDVETANSWSGTTSANAAAVQGFLDNLTAHGVPAVGIYSTIAQWRGITGSYALPQAPNWISGGPDVAGALAYCGSTMTGGPVWLVQAFIGSRSGDYACPGPGAVAAQAPGTVTSPPVGTTVSAALPSGPPALNFLSTACAGGSANVTFNWTPTSASTTQWLDLSLTDNSFGPASFVGAGPLDGRSSRYSWNGLQSGLAYFWRVNDLTAGGWMTSATGAFVPCGGPQLRGTDYACTADGRATVTFFVAAASPSGAANWLDISLADNGFAPGSFLSAGPFDGANQQVVWPGILPNVATYWRYNSALASGWSPSATGSFTVAC
jgi:hypothetical protein